MAIVSKSNQVLYTSEDYVSARQSANKIEKAVALVEKGNSVVNFSAYIDEYTKLMKRVVSTNDLGHNINPNMRNAHHMLSKQVQGLEKRVVAACVHAKVVPPSQDLMQMLKVDQNLSPRPVKSKWTPTVIAKYGAIGGAAALAYSPLLSAIEKIPSFFTKTVLTTIRVVPQAGKALDDAYSAAYTAFTNVGNGVNALRDLGSKVGISTMPSEDPTALGAGTVTDFLLKQSMWKIVKPVVQTILPAGTDSWIGTGITLSTICDATTSDCTKKAINGVQFVTDTAANYPGTTFTGLLSVGIPWLYYRDAIFQSFSAAAGFVKPIGWSAFAVPLATTAVESAVKSANPQLYANLTKQYPYMIPVTNIFGIAGSAIAPWYYNGEIIAAADGVAQTARNAAAVAAAAKVAATNAALGAVPVVGGFVVPQNAVITPEMHDIIRKAADGARDTSLFRQRGVYGLLSAISFVALPVATTAVHEGVTSLAAAASQTPKDVYVKENPIPTSLTIPTGVVVGGVAQRRGWTVKGQPVAVGVGLLSTTLPHIANAAGKAIYKSCATQGGYCNENPIPSALSVPTGLVVGGVAKYRVNTNTRSLTAGFLSTTAPHILSYLGKTIYNSCAIQDGYCNDAYVATSTALSDSRQTGWIKGVEDYVTGNPKTNLGMLPAAVIVGGVAKYKRTSNPRAVGVGLLSTTLPHIANAAGKAIYNSFAEQGGYCNDAYVATTTAISNSMQTGWIKGVEDYVTGNPIPSVLSVPAGVGVGAAVVSKGLTVKGYNKPVAVGVGLLSTTLPHIANAAGKAIYAAGKTIYNSCAIQDGYCNNAYAATTTAINDAYVATTTALSDSRDNGALKPFVDYVTNNPIATGASVITGLLSTAHVFIYPPNNPGATRGKIGVAMGTEVTLATAAPHILDVVGTTIYNSCAEQGGYCNNLLSLVYNNPISTIAISTIVAMGGLAYKKGISASTAIPVLLGAGNSLLKKFYHKPHST